jgi:hypothetical protein
MEVMQVATSRDEAPSVGHDRDKFLFPPMAIPNLIWNGSRDVGRVQVISNKIPRYGIHSRSALGLI